MKKKLLSLLVLLLTAAVGTTRAYEVQIGEGTGTTGYFPFYTLYNYSISECLFRASELAGAGVEAGPISSLSWYATNAPGYEQQGLSIWVANVSDEELTTVSHSTTGMTLVYTGAMTPAIGWNEFVFNENSFSWDGTSNLLIYVQRNNGSWNSTVNWQYTKTEFTSMAYKYQDSGAFDTTAENTMYTSTSRPNIIIKGSAGGSNELTVYDGEATNGYVPIYGFYGDAYLKCEFVMPAAKLSAMNGSPITAMTFYASQDNVDWGAAEFQVFLTEVESTTISAFNGPGTVVYEGSLSIVDGKMTVTFTTPYTYNGGNLLIGFYETKEGKYVTSTWYGEAVSGASVQGYSYSDLSSISATQRDFLPKTTFTYGGGGSEPIISKIWDFEDSTMQGWTTIDADGDGFTWLLASEFMGSGYGHNNSNDCVVSQSYDDTYGVLYPDNYLVSPKVKLGGKISFYACAQDASYPAEHFGVAVSTKGNTDAADFTTIWESTMTAAPVVSAPAAGSQANAPQSAFKITRRAAENNSGTRRAQGNWYLYEIDLSAYADQVGYVAIRHFNCHDEFYLDVDDITISEPATNVDNGPQSGAIELTVPADLNGDGKPTDIYTFLEDALATTPNPAYINLTLESGAKYTISQALSVFQTISIQGADAKNPAIIDASEAAGNFLEIDPINYSGAPNAQGYLGTIDDITLKNITVENMRGSLFNANGAKYLIPTITIDNVLAKTKFGMTVTMIDMNGAAAENISINNSTFFSAYSSIFYAAGAGLAEVGLSTGKMTFAIDHTTFCMMKFVSGFTTSDINMLEMTLDNSVAIGYEVFLDYDLIALLGSANFSLIASNNSIVAASGASLPAEYIKLYEDNIPALANLVEGDYVFANYGELLDGNLGMGDCAQRDAKIGDPRWLNVSTMVPDDLSGWDNDLAAFINYGIENGFTEFQLEEGGSYEVMQSIVADKSLTITGKDTKIVARTSENPFIMLSKTPGVEFLPKFDGSGNTDYYGIEQIKLQGLILDGLKNSLIWDNNTKYCVVDMIIDDCILGFETTAVQNEALIAFQAGGIKDFTMTNSTAYGNNAVAKYFIRYNNSARLDRYGFDKNNDFQTMTYLNNTFYGLLKSDGQWGNYNGISGQVFSKFDVQENIWYNSSNEVIRRMAGGRFSGNNPMTFYHNTYFYNSADNSDKESSYDKSGTILTSDPGFKNTVDHNFSLYMTSDQAMEKTGDPRWLEDLHNVKPTGISNINAEKAATDGEVYNLNGQRVEKARKGLYIINGKKMVVK